MLKKNKIQLVFITALFAHFILTFPSCAPENPHQVDLSGFRVEIPIIRTEADVFKMRSAEDWKLLRDKDSTFFDVYMYGIMSNVTGGSRVSKEENTQALLDFVGNADMQHLFKTVDSTFRDFSPYQEGFNDAFSYYNYHFGSDTLPKIYTFVSPFNYNTVGFEQNLAIGLDLYLGPDFGPYATPQLNFPQFKIAKMRSESLVADAMKAWLMNQFPKEDQDRSLLGEMIYEGKILYAMDAMFPRMHDSLKIGYLNGQIEWCEGNNFQIWQHLVENDLLYSTDLRQYSGVITDGPFSKGQNVPQESSPRMAIWTGWQIVRAYMEKNKTLGLATLMQDTNYESILKKSAYKP